MQNGTQEQTRQPGGNPAAAFSERPNTYAQTQPNHTRSAPVIQFQRAVKRDAKARVALTGVAGSGKSYTMLLLARLLAGPNGRIAVVDTEHGSLSKAYADLIEFDVIELDSYSPEAFASALSSAERSGYDVFCVDSLSHFWTGKDGALEFVDNALKAARSRNNGRADDMTGWNEFRPHERRMVDSIIASPCHVICTMRVKTEYADQVDDKGRKRRVKIGLAPVQRAGIEYEFDLVGDMDEDNTLVIDKSRVMLPDGSTPYARKAIQRPAAKDFEPLLRWLKGNNRVAVAPPPPMPPASSVNRVSADSQPKPWQTVAGMVRIFDQLREEIGEVLYADELRASGVGHPREFAPSGSASKFESQVAGLAAAFECYQRLARIAETQRGAA